MFIWHFMMLKKDLLARRGVDFRSASDLSRGRPMSRFTHLRSLQGLLCDANPLGVTLAPLQSTILQKRLFLFFHTNSSEKGGEAMRDNTSP
ncbi:hypothetical protein JTI58_00370 [Lysinibacillus fusiformis]|uniref:hypothetical protein n=1 Tax=Lysinibacillus fusiformis TaxID=28031 RepID=UPI001967C319|nr:hypothetical protein [Lysinibacillus fusiformis]QSB10207.1 hypothetical protein JTI58_00370 [Lysinibacillus fusiformis]